MKKVLITGASGFIGSALVQEALARGWSVAGLVRPDKILSMKNRHPDGALWFSGSLEDVPWGAINSFAPDICIHSAWISTPGQYLDSPINTQLVELSLDFLRKAWQNGIGYSVVLGTCIEYDSTTGKVLDECATPVTPISLYAQSKNLLRLALEEELVPLGMKLCWGRVFYPYGAGEHPKRLCTSTMRRLHKGEDIVLSTPDSSKDYIEIRDLANAIATVADQQATGVMNLGTGSATTVFEMASAIGRLMGKTELIKRAGAISPDPYPFMVADSTRLRATGWKPRINLDDGLLDLLESINLGDELK